MGTITANRELNRLGILACRVGCPQDQLARFLQAGYVPQPRQLEFHAAARECDDAGGPDRIGYGGTRGQAKSHAALAQLVIDDMQQVEGLKGLYLRKVGKKAQESFEDLSRKVLRFLPHKPSIGKLALPNGSFVIMGGFHTENQIDDYLGIEYDVIVLEDAPSLTKSKYDAVRGSLRTSREDWRPRLYATANPGGVGHQWYKAEFYDPWKRDREFETRFIHTTLGDNVFINPEYERYLNSLTGWLRRAWRDGDFEISAGQFFNTWDTNIHVIEPFDVPHGWRVWAALDYGFVHWNEIGLFVEDGDGNVYLIDEHAARRWLVPQHANAVKAMLGRSNYRLSDLYQFVSGPDVFAQRGGDEETVADKYEKEGITLIPAPTDRINGAAEVLARLGNPEADVKPSLFIFSRCRRLIECLPILEHDPHRPEDILKIDCDSDTGQGGDDSYDMLRYGLMARPRTTQAHVY